jgi:hypothetical protein
MQQRQVQSTEGGQSNSGRKEASVRLASRYSWHMADLEETATAKQIDPTEEIDKLTNEGQRKKHKTRHK